MAALRDGAGGRCRLLLSWCCRPTSSCRAACTRGRRLPQPTTLASRQQALQDWPHPTGGRHRRRRALVIGAAACPEDSPAARMCVQTPDNTFIPSSSGSEGSAASTKPLCVQECQEGQQQLAASGSPPDAQAPQVRWLHNRPHANDRVRVLTVRQAACRTKRALPAVRMTVAHLTGMSQLRCCCQAHLQDQQQQPFAALLQAQHDGGGSGASAARMHAPPGGTAPSSSTSSRPLRLSGAPPDASDEDMRQQRVMLETSDQAAAAVSART